MVLERPHRYDLHPGDDEVQRDRLHHPGVRAPLATSLRLELAPVQRRYRVEDGGAVLFVFEQRPVVERAASIFSLITPASLQEAGRYPRYTTSRLEIWRSATWRPCSRWSWCLRRQPFTRPGTYSPSAPETGGAVFVWLFGFLAMLIYAPLAVVVVLLGEALFRPEALVFMFGSGVLHLGYFIFCSEDTRSGDLSLVYPLARGTWGPLLATAAAIVVLGERPGTVALLGIALITVGVFMLTVEPGNARKAGWGKQSVVYGLLTGAFIAAYTIWDKHAVSALLIPPLLQSWVTTLVTTGLLTPLAVRHRGKVLAIWREHKIEALGVAVLSPARISWSLRRLSSRLRYVAPAREISILIGAVMGGEPARGSWDVRRRLVAATFMVLGFAALALS